MLLLAVAFQALPAAGRESMASMFAATIVASAHAAKPHIWAVMVDDLGWNGMGFSGNNDEILTPTVNALAKSGVILTSHYSYKFCSPTRASFLTGRIAGHGIQETNLGQTSSVGCNLNLTMIGAKMKAAGYVTLQVGKCECIPQTSLMLQRLILIDSHASVFFVFILFLDRAPRLLPRKLHTARSWLRHQRWLSGRRRRPPLAVPRLRQQHPVAGLGH